MWSQAQSIKLDSFVRCSTGSSQSVSNCIGYSLCCGLHSIGLLVVVYEVGDGCWLWLLMNETQPQLRSLLQGLPQTWHQGRASRYRLCSTWYIKTYDSLVREVEAEFHDFRLLPPWKRSLGTAVKWVRSNPPPPPSPRAVVLTWKVLLFFKCICVSAM